AAQGKRQHEFHRADNGRPFPRAAGEGGSTDPEGGRLLILILIAWSKIRSAPFTPIWGSFPRCAGEATARVSRSARQLPSLPRKAGEGGSTDPEGGRLLILI